tara:strand:+ start:626 stop:1918 length:1293 start_codon:yes stop_codon:yes gene_type:complete
LNNNICEIRDPIHGYIHISEVEKEIIDSPLFQRLRRIRQLSGAHLTYPGAQHSRFEHSIGTMHLGGLTGNIILKKTPINKDFIQEIRLASLLHDIGHGPFSHLIEEVMTEKHGITHETVTQRVILETEIKDILNRHGFDPNAISEFIVGLSTKRPRFMSDIVGGGLSVDIMDYLLRDSYFTGVEYGKVDILRIINSFELKDDKLALNRDALYAFEALMIARYEMFRAVYFHRTVRASELMLIRSISLADEILGLTDTNDLNKYLQQNDETTLNMLVNISDDQKELKQSKDLAINYRDRNLVKCVYEKTIHRKDQLMESIFLQKSIREDLVRKIAEEANVPPDEVYLDVSTTPSVPLTSARQALTSIILATTNSNGIKYEEVRVDELPLIGAISGFFNILRVYTSNINRKTVEEASSKTFGESSYSSKISM